MFGTMSCGVQIPSAEITKMAAPGRSHENEGREKKNDHEKVGSTIDGATEDKRRDRKVEGVGVHEKMGINDESYGEEDFQPPKARKKALEKHERGANHHLHDAEDKNREECHRRGRPDAFAVFRSKIQTQTSNTEKKRRERREKRHRAKDDQEATDGHPDGEADADKEDRRLKPGQGASEERDAQGACDPGFAPNQSEGRQDNGHSAAEVSPTQEMRPEDDDNHGEAQDRPGETKAAPQL